MPTPQYPITPGLHYTLPAYIDPGIAHPDFSTGDWSISRGFPGNSQIVGSNFGGTKGHELVWDGTNLRLKLPRVGSSPWGSGDFGTARYLVNETDAAKVDFVITYPTITKSEIDKYKHSFTLGAIPSAERLSKPVTITWKRQYRPTTSYPAANIGTGATVTHDFPEPSVALHGSNFVAYTVTATVKNSDSDEWAAGTTADIQEALSSQSAAVHGLRGLEIRLPVTASGGASMQVNAFLTTMDGSTATGSLRSQPFPFSKNPCVWIVGNDIFISVQKWDYRTSSPQSQVELWRSRDFLRTKELVAVIWESAQWWAGQTFKLEPYGAISPAIKRNTTPSEVWVKVSLDRVTWEPGGLCYLVHVGNLPSDSKEPLSVVQRDNGIELTNGTSSWRYWSTDFGKTWEAAG